MERNQVSFVACIKLNRHRTVSREFSHLVLNSPADINLDISKTTTASLIAFETRYQFVRTVAPSYHGGGDIYFAAGLPNGKVALCNFAAENNVEFSK